MALAATLLHVIGGTRLARRQLLTLETRTPLNTEYKNNGIQNLQVSFGSLSFGGILCHYLIYPIPSQEPGQIAQGVASLPPLF